MEVRETYCSLYSCMHIQESPLDVEKVKTPELSSYWLSGLGLTLDDQQILASGRRLRCRHISAVHTLLRQKYPQQNGLQDTLQLSNNFKWVSKSTDFIQIIHISQNHWVCASNLLTPPGIVEPYDSLPATCNITLIKQIAAILQTSDPKLVLRWVNVQCQSGKDECALFAIAFAEVLCSGSDSRVLNFDQGQMRKHLQLCLERGTITSFPETIKRSRSSSRMKMSRNVDVYYDCRMPWDKRGKMVQCPTYRECYHQVCLNISDVVFQDPTYIWLCKKCEQQVENM